MCKNLNDTFWSYRTSNKIIIGTSPCHIVFGKACHLLEELEHQAYWAGPFNVERLTQHGTIEFKDETNLTNLVNWYRLKYFFGIDSDLDPDTLEINDE